MAQMSAAGLQPRIDPAGNIFARREGTEPRLPPILFGSHIDSVPGGGNFDGDLGSLSALGALEALGAGRRAHAAPARDGRLGARGELRLRPRSRLQPHRRRRVRAGRLDEVWNGMRRADAIRKIGGNPDRIARGAAAQGIAPLLPRAAHRAGRHARARAASRSASSKASSRSIATTRRSPASPITPARRRSPNATTRCWPPRT